MLTSRRAKLESCRQPHGLPLFQASAGLDQARGNELQRRLEAWRHWGSGVGTELSWEWRVKLGQRLSCGGNTAPKPDLYGCLLFQTEMWIKVRRTPAWRFTFFGQKQMVVWLTYWHALWLTSGTMELGIQPLIFQMNLLKSTWVNLRCGGEKQVLRPWLCVMEQIGFKVIFELWWRTQPMVTACGVNGVTSLKHPRLESLDRTLFKTGSR